MRNAFVRALTDAASRDDRIVFLTGDLGFKLFDDFARQYPGRFINVGVAEATMAGVATGLALEGKKPFIYSIATFASMRPYEFVAQNLVPVRAYENGLHIAYTNRCGPEGRYDFAGLSCLAGPDGAVRARAGAGAELLVADVDPEVARVARAETPYLAYRRPELYRSLA